MKKNKSIKLLVAIITLAMPQIVFATKYIVCDNDKKIPYCPFDNDCAALKKIYNFF